MIIRRFWVTGLLVLWTAVSASADAVVMYNGQRLDGQIVGETEDEVWLRQRRPDGVRFIRKIHRFNITRVEREGQAGSQPSSAPAEVEEQAPPIQPDAEKLKRLDQIISKYQQEDFEWAGFLVTQLITRSSPGELAYMSAEVQKRLKMSLAELAASSHFKAAEPAKPGERIRLPYVTHYERSALLKLLTRAHEEALGQSIEETTDEFAATITTETGSHQRHQPQAEDAGYMTVDPIPSGPRETEGSPGSPEADSPPITDQRRTERPTAPSEQGPVAGTPAQRAGDPRGGGASSLRPVSAGGTSRGVVRSTASRPTAWLAQRPTTPIDWLDRPEDYDGTPAEAEAMVKHVQYTISLLSERIRLDTKARTDPAFKTALIQEKDRLGLLLKAARSQAKGNLTPKERAAILAERKRLEGSHRKEVVPRELLIEEFVREGRKDGPPPGKYPTTSASGNVELVPVDVHTP